MRANDELELAGGESIVRTRRGNKESTSKDRLGSIELVVTSEVHCPMPAYLVSAYDFILQSATIRAGLSA